MNIAIVGGGISGLSLAYYLLENLQGFNIKIFESETRIGGKILTEKINGFLCEGGVNGFLDNKPFTLELAARLNLTPVKCNEYAKRRYLFTNSKLKLIATSPLNFLLSDLLSLKGKIRMFCEFFIPKTTLEDESLESFAIRRVGKEFFEKILDPMASGIYAGDPSKMSIRSCFNMVYDLEQKYGGLIKGFIAMNRQKKSEKRVSAAPGGQLMSFYDGMYSLIENLKIYLGDRIEINKTLETIERNKNTYTLIFKDGFIYECDIAILSIPAHNASIALKELDKNLYNVLDEIPYPALSVVSMGYSQDKITRDKNLFGFLLPAKENRKILGTLFDSSIFPNRAPNGFVLLRTMVGGARNQKLAALEDEKLISLVKEELAYIFDIKSEPDFIKIIRWQKAIPQYTVGHYQRLKKIDELLLKHKGLFLSGNAFRGVSVNDCVMNSFKLAQTIIETTTQ